MDDLSYLHNADPEAIEQLYLQFKKDPESVEISWRKFFQGFDFAVSTYKTTQTGSMEMSDEFKVINLINGYRQRGHLFTKTNPVRTRRQYSPTLDIENFGLKPGDLDRVFHAGNEIGIGNASLSDIIKHLDETYCWSVGAEYYYIRNREINQWLQKRMESSCNRPVFDNPQKVHLLEKLSEAVLFEKFIHTKFPGQKRFSLEGAESLIPALDQVIELSAELGSVEFVIGMPHRGRLNVLANILGKSMADIFSEFEGKEYEDATKLGDVKYHLGFTADRITDTGKKIKLTLAPNPSHLEAVGPVMQGIVRARIDSLYGSDSVKVAPILIHGDASIAGQGIVYEIQQMSELPGYHVGGTIHLVINNQIGFTTNYLEARSSTYCTDVAKVTQSPVFHVNGDDVEAVAYTVNLAMEFREKFNKDVFIDILCYRKYGHNESDEPRFTQPLLYKIIEKHPNPKEIYLKKLLEKKCITSEQADAIVSKFNENMEADLVKAKGTEKSKITSFLEKTWSSIKKASPEDFISSPDTGIEEKKLREIINTITTSPKDKIMFRKITKLLDDRRKMVFEAGIADWAIAEQLAYGSLLTEGIPVRLSGQDVGRGTFSHRHAVLTQEDTGETYTPLQHLTADQAAFEIYNSPLSEYGVLGFEYGYSLASPNTLTIWEAQFGDFNNGAQIIIDQFLTSAEEKWSVMNDLVMYLPHGYEGQGPEHSSARLERFLTQCAELNIQVVNCTTPANFFHVLRRQLHRSFRKPLIIFTPKSLLRHPDCISPISEFTSGGFRELIDDAVADKERVVKVVFCSGKIYYDLIEEKEKLKALDTAIVRIEQLYPLPVEQIREIIQSYPNAYKHLWVQEEPANMGAWSFIARNLNEVNLMLVARPESGSTSTGSGKLHILRQRKIVEKTFGGCTCDRINDVCKMTCAPKEWKFIGSTETKDQVQAEQK